MIHYVPASKLWWELHSERFILTRRNNKLEAVTYCAFYVLLLGKYKPKKMHLPEHVKYIATEIPSRNQSWLNEMFYRRKLNYEKQFTRPTYRKIKPVIDPITLTEIDLISDISVKFGIDFDSYKYTKTMKMGKIVRPFLVLCWLIKLAPTRQLQRTNFYWTHAF